MRRGGDGAGGDGAGGMARAWPRGLQPPRMLTPPWSPMALRGEHGGILPEGEREPIPSQCLNKQSFCAKQRLMYFIVQCHVYSGLLEEKNVINCPETHGSTIIWLL